MTIALRGYTVTAQLYENPVTIVYRGYRQSDQTPVVIKTLRAEYPTAHDIARLQHEYRITRDLNIPGVRQSYDLVDYRNGLALIMEDFGGIPLSEHIAQHRLDLPRILAIGIQLTHILEALHQQQIIHKDIKPQNLILNRSTYEVQLTDFGISTRLSRESQSFSSPNVLEGTFAYISPEQTGRMNRVIDYRTDYYSLGVTLYELLAGGLPFEGEDPMEMVHSHIAIPPVPPHSRQPEIPPILSAIVLKLMAKNAEDRYQSSYGLRVDLQECLRQWQATGTIANFPLAQQDISDRLEISQKLYGREVEAATLMQAFERVSAGSSELMLVSGYSGIGKSALINEVHRPLVQSRGYFISGKFDQFQRSVPYASVIQAFRELIQQILSESESQTQAWRDKILAALGNNGQIITDVIPALELIIGEQPDLPDLPPTESQNRFNSVMQNFVRVFAQPNHPLVMFLDDLQWTDSATLKLIEVLATDPDSKYLLLIGAYRDNEVSPSHPLMLTLDEVQKSSATIDRVTLAPLTQANIEQLVADTLHCQGDRATSLSALIFSKTHGNPFFSLELLKFTHQEGLLVFNAGDRQWQWDLPGIESLNVTENVVDLMTRKLLKLQERTLAVLKLAACIGNRFDLQTLAVVHEQSTAITADDLWEAVLMGLVVPLTEAYKFVAIDRVMENGASTWIVNYKFLHDRVQQSIYALMPEAARQTTHLTIGRLLLSNTSEAEQEEKLFEIVNQLNIAGDLITDPQERLELARLDLRAGQKAKAATAYEPAYEYLNAGMKLLPENTWEVQYDLTLNTHCLLAECCYLINQIQRSEELLDIALEYATTQIDKAQIYNLKVVLYATLNQVNNLLLAGRTGLDLVGIEVPNNEAMQSAIETELAQVQSILKDRKTEDLIQLPEVRDVEKGRGLDILRDMLAPAYLLDKNLAFLIALKMINLSLQFGLSSAVSLAYTIYGVTVGAGFGNFQIGHEYGKLAISITERFNDTLLKCKANLTFGTFINHWREHFKFNEDYLVKAYGYGLESGDFTYATYAVLQRLYRFAESGLSLEECYDQALKYVGFLKKQSDPASQLMYTSTCRVILDFKGASEEQLLQLLGTNAYQNESQLLNQFQRLEEQSTTQIYHVQRLTVAYFFNRFDSALEIASSSAASVATGLLGQYRTVEHNVYYSLTLTTLYATATPEERQSYWQTLEANQQQMRIWADNCSENFLHKYLLVAAEMAQLQGQDREAADLYDRAIYEAHVNEFQHLEALGNELAAKFYLARGRTKIAKAYMQDARLGYLRWGAAAKVALLDQNYTELLEIRPEGDTTLPSTGGTTNLSATTTANTKLLDLMTVIKASQTLSGEIVFSRLLSRLMHIVIENAGAQRGAFVLDRDGQLFVEATGRLNPDTNKPEVTLHPALPLADADSLSTAVIYYTRRTQETLILNDVLRDDRFVNDPYAIRVQPKSVLCLPVMYQGKLSGLLYLENNLSTYVFTVDRLEVLRLIAAQVAISIENTKLYSDLQRYSEELQQSFDNLQRAQLQLIQSEKMSSLGLLVAGIAHEINNPVSFISSNLGYANQYVQDLMDLLALYEQGETNASPQVQEKMEDIELDYLKEDLPRMLNSMQVGTDRIRQLSVSMRTFSRADQSTKSPMNLQEGIESTLLILEHRLKANPQRPRIQVEKVYGNLPPVPCFGGQLNQVFMNLLANAIDALDEASQGRSYQELEAQPNIITVTTEVVPVGSEVTQDSVLVPPYARIRVKDNGPGMPEEVRAHIFESLFTTKESGKGTGLGLSISHQIVVEKHGGRLICISSPGEGAEFVVEIPMQ